MSKVGITKVLALARDDWQVKRYMNFICRDNWEVLFDDKWEKKVVDEVEPDIILTLADSYFSIYHLCNRARERKIPVLLILDGLLEWRHTWENPRFAYGGGVPLYQPVECDKIACYGWQNARTLESWGNIGKCELVGDPRFDQYLNLKRIIHDGKKRLMIMSANTPGYTNEQKSNVVGAFKDLKTYLDKRDDIEIIWRLRKAMDKELAVANKNGSVYGRTLTEILPHMDAVISQPSTVVLEPMLLNIPTALLDYQNAPRYIHAVWHINSGAVIEKTIEKMLNPEPYALLYQDELLHNQLECRTPAAYRLVSLIEKMVELGRDARKYDKELFFPSRILHPEVNGYALPSELFDLSLLYPGHPILREKDLNKLQHELIYAKQELELVKKELDIRGISYWTTLGLRKLHQYIKKKFR